MKIDSMIKQRQAIRCGMVLLGAFLALSACTNLTEPQSPSMALITTVPADGATNVPTDSEIMAQFLAGSNIDQETLNTNNVWLIKEGIEPVAIQLDYTPTALGGTLQLHAGSLENATTYVVVLGNGITVNGVSLDQVLRGQADLAAQHLAGDGSRWDRNREPAAQQDGNSPTDTAQPAKLSISVNDLVGQSSPLAGQQDGPSAADAPNIAPGIVGQFQNIAYSWSFTTVGTSNSNLASLDQACHSSADCASGLACIDSLCTASSHCDNAQLDGDETDLDCGGSCPEKCADSMACNVGDDCQSGVCDAGSCQAPSCLDSVKNGLESDVDCGGVCPWKCADGFACLDASDCESNNCTSQICGGPL